LTTGPADIAEIFSSIQGEGILVGRRQIFVRFFPCNLLCAYCDTPARKADANLCRIEKTPGRKDFFTVPSRVSAESLSSLIDSFEGFSGLHHSISLTGGEPLIQADFLKGWLPLVRDRFSIYLETNGSMSGKLNEVIDNLDIIAMDIKLPETAGIRPLWDEHSRFLEIAAKREVFVKVVVSGKTPVDEFNSAVNVVSSVNGNIPFVIQPVTGMGKALAISPSRLMDLQRQALEALSDVRVIPQTHKMTGVL